MQELNHTAHKILDVAERYTQMYGFNAFSYKTLQNEVGVKTSSIHYYFPTKQDLVLRMTERYVQRFRSDLDAMAQEHSLGLKRLEHLGKLYINALNQGKFCMCGMLASDMLSLPDAVNGKLCEFFQFVEAWITDAINAGKKQGDVRESVNAERSASLFMAALEGGMLIARTQNDPEYLASVATEVLTRLSR